MRLGLCCLFVNQPIKFRNTTVTHLSKLTSNEVKDKLSELCYHNASSLMMALEYCKNNHIGSFRISSGILPMKTHPEFNYELSDLHHGQDIINKFNECGEYAKYNNIRTTFHPDQFVVLNSPHEHIANQSLNEIEYQTKISQLVHADVIIIHAGGVYGDKESALIRFKQNYNKLSEDARKLVAVENDDKSYTPQDLLPLNIPLVYDVHHHRCNSDELSVVETTNLAINTWNREPLFHISSPLNGWGFAKERQHHDYIDLCDFPENWKNLNVTIEVEAKAKELAVKRLTDVLNHKEN